MPSLIDKDPMRSYSYTLPGADVEAIEKMVEDGFFPSKSAAIRCAVKILLAISAGLIPDAERAFLLQYNKEKKDAQRDIRRYGVSVENTPE